MKKFNEYLNEDFDPAIFNADGGISITDPTVMDAINSNLEVSTSCTFRTPYNALEEVRKVLSYYKIFLPKSMFLDQNHGNDVFEVSQFGEKMGMNNQGEVVTASDSPLFVYFEWSLNEKGMYDTFAALVNQEELDEILADYDAEVSDDETDLQEQHSMGKVSKMLYKVVNQMKASKQSDDVDSLINHEKEGKTFTQVNEASSKKLGKYLDKVNKLNRKELKARGNKPSLAAGKILNVGVKVPATNEEAMPNAKKMMASKMSKKKVTLANMNKEETINEGRPSQRHPLEGHEYHRKSDAELTYIGKDAHKAAEAMKGHNEKAEAKYLDQANDAATVRHFRKRNGMPNWYKKKYGHDKK
jgi:hypothetical protein